MKPPSPCSALCSTEGGQASARESGEVASVCKCAFFRTWPQWTSDLSTHSHTHNLGTLQSISAAVCAPPVSALKSTNFGVGVSSMMGSQDPRTRTHESEVRQACDRKCPEMELRYRRRTSIYHAHVNFDLPIIRDPLSPNPRPYTLHTKARARHHFP